jgi:hypothetical protein
VSAAVIPTSAGDPEAAAAVPLAGKGKAAASPAADKGKGKVSGEASAAASAAAKAFPGDDGVALATMDIFAGCGGLSEGMHQAGEQLKEGSEHAGAEKSSKNAKPCCGIAPGQRLFQIKRSLSPPLCYPPTSDCPTAAVRGVPGTTPQPLPPPSPAGAAVTKWGIEYERPASAAFQVNNPEAAVFCNNCNVLLHAAMTKAGLEDDCDACGEARGGPALCCERWRCRVPRCIAACAEWPRPGCASVCCFSCGLDPPPPCRNAVANPPRQTTPRRALPSCLPSRWRRCRCLERWSSSAVGG